MSRPEKTEKRDQQLNIKLTQRELAWLRTRALSVGMKPFEYGRAQLLYDRPARRASPQASPHLDPLFFAHLSRIGNNLNQIARRLHGLRMNAPPELTEALAEVREAIRGGASHGP